MKYIYTAIPLISFFLLSGCFDSEAKKPKERPIALISGTVTDAKLINSTISARIWNQETGDCNEPIIAQAQTDLNGEYSLDIQADDNYICLESRAGYYVEEASGKRVDLEEHHYLEGLVSFQSGQAVKISITPATSMAAALIKYNRKKGGYQPIDAYSLGNQAITNMWGIEIHKVTPADTTDPKYASPVLSDSLRYGMMLAGFSSLTKSIAEKQGIEGHSNSSFTSIQMAYLAAQDLINDGKLDGIGLSRDGQEIKLSMGVEPLSFQTFRNKVSEHILKFAKSDKNKTGLQPKDYLAFAQERAGSTGDIWDNAAAHSVDLIGPTIATQISDNYTFQGMSTFTYAIEDLIGVQKSTLYINDVEVAGAIGGDVVFEIDTSRFEDGVKTLKVVSLDTLENESIHTKTVNFDNTGVAVNTTSNLLSNSTDYKLEGTYTTVADDLAKVVVYWMTKDPVDKNGDGVTTPQERDNITYTKHTKEATIDRTNKTWSASFKLYQVGSNDIKIYSVDNAGNQGADIPLQIDVDAQTPLITIVDIDARYSAQNGDYNSCTTTTLVLDDGISNTYPICIRGDRLLLDGRTPEPQLISDGYSLINFTVKDMESTIRTTNNELKVEYRYTKNQDTANPVVDWKILPKRYAEDHSDYAAKGNDYVLVFSQEYLGNNWWNTTISDLQQLELRVSDNAGNVKTKLFNLKFEIFNVPNPADVVYVGESIFSGKTFDSRTQVDSQNYKVEYTYTHNGYNAMWVKLNESQEHVAKLQYEKKWRSSVARLVQWTETKKNDNYSHGYYCDAGQHLVDRDHMSSAAVAISTTYGAYMTMYSDVSTATSYSPGSGWTKSHSGTTCTWQRSGSRYEYQAGYPRNNSSDHWKADVSFDTASFKVEDTTRGQVLSAQHGGWYYIPADTTFKVTKNVTLPILNHHNDIDVIDAGFNSYSYRYLDKDLQWYIDTRLTLKLYHYSFYYDTACKATNTCTEMEGDRRDTIPQDDWRAASVDLGDGRKYHRINR